jgi:hypothetical protein
VDALPLEDGEVDATVASSSCAATRRGARSPNCTAMRPGGELHFYEHVIARCQPKRAILQLADHSGLWPTIGGGCHPARDTGAAITAAGFASEAASDSPSAPGLSSPASRTSSASLGASDPLAHTSGALLAVCSRQW